MLKNTLLISDYAAIHKSDFTGHSQCITAIFSYNHIQAEQATNVGQKTGDAFSSINTWNCLPTEAVYVNDKCQNGLQKYN